MSRFSRTYTGDQLFRQCESVESIASATTQDFYAKLVRRDKEMREYRKLLPRRKTFALKSCVVAMLKNSNENKFLFFMFLLQWIGQTHVLLSKKHEKILSYLHIWWRRGDISLDGGLSSCIQLPCSGFIWNGLVIAGGSCHVHSCTFLCKDSGAGHADPRLPLSVCPIFQQ